ncbi:MAG: hypothetical protein RL385_5968 [Pseudomonadota bacterium]
MPLLSHLATLHRPEHDVTALEPAHIAGFKRSQALAYDAVQDVEKQLTAGMTERDAAQLVHEALRTRGVRAYFHQPFAWFGERTAFVGFHQPLQFFPTRKKLELGMPVILDVAPIVDGHASDIGYACKLGENALHDQMLRDLLPYRQLILDGVRAKKAMNAIYADVDRLIERQGYLNRHRAYPFRVLAHRVNFVPMEARTEFKIAGFGVPAISYLFGQIGRALHAGQSHVPLWNDLSSSAHPATPGLWAVEPHLGFRGVGVKWEELLVVTEDSAYWLDDQLPHVTRLAGEASTSRREASL